MKRFFNLGSVLFLIVAFIFFFDTIGFYLWTRATATALRDGKPAPEIALYQRDGKFLVQDGPYYYLIGEQPGIVGMGSPSDFYQFHANYLHCRTSMPRTVEMNSAKVETDPKLVVGDGYLEFTNSRQQRVKVTTSEVR